MQYRAQLDVDTCHVAEDGSTCAKLEGLRSRRADRILDGNVVARTTSTANPNMVGGDRVGGSHRLSRNALFRPRRSRRPLLPQRRGEGDDLRLGMHIDFCPDVPFGALFPFLESVADLDNGMSVVAAAPAACRAPSPRWRARPAPSSAPFRLARSSPPGRV